MGLEKIDGVSDEKMDTIYCVGAPYESCIK